LRRGFERWVFWLDERFRIPFTRVRFGLDAILGVVPGLGDVAGALLGLPILVSGIKRRLPFSVLLLMTVNVLLDVVIGSIPIAGDLFDVAWKVHRKNLLLLERPEEMTEVLREARWKLVGLIGALFILVVSLLTLVAWIFEVTLGWVADAPI